MKPSELQIRQEIRELRRQVKALQRAIARLERKPPRPWTGSIEGMDGAWTVTPPPEFAGDAA